MSTLTRLLLHLTGLDVERGNHPYILIIVKARCECGTVDSFDADAHTIMDHIAGICVDELRSHHCVSSSRTGSNQILLFQGHVEVQRTTAIQAKLIFLSLQLLKEWQRQGRGGAIGGAADPNHHLCVTSVIAVFDRRCIAEIHPDTGSLDAIIAEKVAEVGGIAKAPKAPTEQFVETVISPIGSPPFGWCCLTKG